MSNVPNVLIEAQSGVGAHSYVRGLVANALCIGQPVLILDVGRNYELFCRLMGGTIWRLHTTQDGLSTPMLSTSDAKHSSPLQVFDFAAVQSPWSAALPAAEDTFRTRRGLLVVEDVEAIRARFPGVDAFIGEHLQAGGRCCLMGERQQTLEPFKTLCAPSVFRTFSQNADAVR
jgi:hypothetical protein